VCMSTSGFSQGDSKKSGEPLRARAAVRRSRRRRGDGAKIKKSPAQFFRLRR
jgi:hypothetical protein